MMPVFIVVAIDSMGMGVILPLLPFYAERFGASPLVIGTLFATFALCQFVAGPLLGAWSDRVGRKPILIGSQVGTCASFVLLALSNSLPMLFLARILDGLTSGNLSVAAAYAVDHSTPATRKQAIGVVSAGVGVGLVVGPALSTLSGHLAPAAPIWIAAALSAASLIATILLLPSERRSAEPAVDTKKGNSDVSTPSSAVAVLSLLTCFYLAIGMMMGGLAVFLAKRFNWQGHPFGPTEVGVVFTCTGVINIVVQLVIMKHASKHWTDKQLTVACFLLMAGGYALTGAVEAPVLLGLALAAAALGSSLLRPTLTAVLSLSAPAARQGAVMGLNQSVMAISNIVGPLLGGLVLDHGWYSGWIFSLSALLGCTAVGALICIALGWWPSASSNPFLVHQPKEHS